MGLVDHQIGPGLALDGGDLAKGRDVAHHRIDALDHDHPVARCIAEAAQAFGQILGVVVAETDDLGMAQPRPVIDAGMAVGVQDQVIAAPDKGRQDAQIGLVPGGEDHGMLATIEGGQRRLHGQVPVETAVGDPRAGGARAPGSRGLDGGLDTGRIEGQPQIVVRAQQDDASPAVFGLGRGQDGVEPHAERVGPERADGLVGLDLRQISIEQSHSSGLLTQGGYDVGQVADGLDRRQSVERHRDIERILQLHDDVHQGQGIDGEIARDVGVTIDRHCASEHQLDRLLNLMDRQVRHCRLTHARLPMEPQHPLPNRLSDKLPENCHTSDARLSD